MPQRYRVASCGQYPLNGFACVNLRPSRSVGIAAANRPRQFELAPELRDPIGSSDLRAEALALFRLLQVSPRGCH